MEVVRGVRVILEHVGYKGACNRAPSSVAARVSGIGQLIEIAS